jgi:hypothetical protein
MLAVIVRREDRQPNCLLWCCPWRVVRLTVPLRARDWLILVERLGAWLQQRE